MTYTKVNAAPLVETTKLEAAPKILELFLPIVKLFDANALPLSIKCTSLPIAGDAGKLIVTAVPTSINIKQWDGVVPGVSQTWTRIQTP